MRRSCLEDPKIWVVSELYYPEDTSTGHYLTRIAERLARRRDVAVLCGQPTYAQRGTRAPRRENRHGVSIVRCPALQLNKDNLVLRLANWITLSISVLVASLTRMRRGDLALVVTTPPVLPLVVMCASALRGVRYVVLVHDVYPDALAVAGGLRSSGLAYRAAQRLLGGVYSRADRVVVLGRGMRELLVSRYPSLRSKIAVIPNWSDVDIVRPLPRGGNRLLRDAGMSGRFIAQCVGNLGRTHAIEDLVVAVDQVASDGVGLLLAGFGAKRAHAERLSSSRPHMCVLDRVPQHRLAELLAACDVAVVPLVGGMAGVSVPSRTYNILAAGKPIIAVAEPASELALLVEEERVGWIVAPGDIDALSESLLHAKEQPTLLQAMSHRARRVAETRFHPDEIFSRYEMLFEELLNAGDATT